MEEKIFKTIKKYNMLHLGDNVVVALSGGADSIALFHFLYQNREKLQINLSIAHLNHGLRGKESDGDEEFVKNVAEKYNLPFHVKHEHMSTQQAPKGMGTEQWARQLRYSFLQDVAEKQCAKIATAHTLSDNCETLLFHLARGTSVKGTAGIARVRENIIRPFIEITRTEVESYCDNNNLEYVTDSTNLTDDYTRNNIRHNVLPVLISINSKAETSMGRFLNNQKEIYDYFDKQARILLNDAEIESGKYDRNILRKADDLILKQALAILIDTKTDVNSTKLNLVFDLFENEKGAVEIKKNEILVINDKFLYWKELIIQTVCKEKELVIGENVLFDGCIVYAEQLNCKKNMKFPDISKKALKFHADYGKINADMLLRTRQTGDTFKPIGRNCSKSLKKFFIEQKTPVADRDKTPVLAQGSKIVWVAGFGFAKGYEVTSDTQDILKLSLAF